MLIKLMWLEECKPKADKLNFHEDPTHQYSLHSLVALPCTFFFLYFFPAVAEKLKSTSVGYQDALRGAVTRRAVLQKSPGWLAGWLA